ncbi:MAG: MarR family transcriptional regulator [Gemmatimonadetes bacterium]|nr:MarR family transcriptional regulator [Gemmatimonadota bacterium]
MPPRQPAAARAADRLHSAAIHLLRRLRTEDDASGLSAPRLSALSVIVFGGPITLGDLARREQVRPPTITRVVRDLAQLGLVALEPDPADARVRRAVATARGRRLLDEGRRRRVAALTDAIAALPARERARLIGALDVLERVARPEAPRAAPRPRDPAPGR